MIHLISFGHKYGVPKGVHLLYDARSIYNPHHDRALRRLTGLHPKVRRELDHTGGFQRLRNQIYSDILKLTVASSSDIYVAIGCTGGRHRSVALVEAVSEMLGSNGVSVVHRDREYWRR